MKKQTKKTTKKQARAVKSATLTLPLASHDPSDQPDKPRMDEGQPSDDIFKTEEEEGEAPADGDAVDDGTGDEMPEEEELDDAEAGGVVCTEELPKVEIKIEDLDSPRAEQAEVIEATCELVEEDCKVEQTDTKEEDVEMQNIEETLPLEDLEPKDGGPHEKEIEKGCLVNEEASTNGDDIKTEDSDIVENSLAATGADQNNPIDCMEDEVDIEIEIKEQVDTETEPQDGNGSLETNQAEQKLTDDILEGNKPGGDTTKEIKLNGSLNTEEEEEESDEDEESQPSTDNHRPCHEMEALCTKIKGMSIRNSEKDNLLELGGEDMAEDEKDMEDLQKDFVYKCMSTLAPHRVEPTLAAGDLSVVSCLKRFTAAERLSGTNKFLCDNCTKQQHQMGPGGKLKSAYSDASKQTLILSCPAILTLHLKRFQQEGYTFRKINKHVSFPLVLDLAPYVSAVASALPHMADGNSRVLYSLYGVVEHQGRLSNGHYTAYVRVASNAPTPPPSALRFAVHQPLDLDMLKSHSRLRAPAGPTPAVHPLNPGPGRWFYVSDESVREVSESQVLKCQAYLLFYQRIL